MIEGAVSTRRSRPQNSALFRDHRVMDRVSGHRGLGHVSAQEAETCAETCPRPNPGTCFSTLYCRSCSESNGSPSESGTTHALCTGGTPSTSRSFSNEVGGYLRRKNGHLAVPQLLVFTCNIDFWNWTLLTLRRAIVVTVSLSAVVPVSSSVRPNAAARTRLQTRHRRSFIRPVRQHAAATCFAGKFAVCPGICADGRHVRRCSRAILCRAPRRL